MKEFLTAKEAAEYIGIKLSYLYQLTHEKKIPHYKPTGKIIFFKLDEIIDFLNQGRVKTQAEIEAEAAAFNLKKC